MENKSGFLYSGVSVLTIALHPIVIPELRLLVRTPPNRASGSRDAGELPDLRNPICRMHF